MNTKMLGYGLAFGLALALTPALGASAEDAAITQLLADLRALIERQERQIERLEQRVEELEQRDHGDRTDAHARATAAPLAARATPASILQDAPKAAPAAAPASGPGSVLSRFGLTLYGYVKLDAAYDTHKTTAGNLAYRVLPKQGMGNDDELNLTAKQTRIGLRLNGPEFGEWKTRGVVEMDFYGSASENAANPRMRLAYVQVESDRWRLQAGQAFDLWQNVTARTLNFATLGQHGAVWSRRPSAYALRKWDFGDHQRLEAGAGVARTVGQDLDGDGQDDGKDSGRPNLQWTIVYHSKFAHGAARFGIGGHYGWESLDLAGMDAKTYNTGLIVGSFHMPIASRLTLAGMIWTGKNLLDFNGGIGQGINLGKDRAIRATGGWLQLGWQQTAALQWTIFGGIDDPRDADINPGQRSSNRTIGGNVFWSATPALTLAFEYQFMETEYLATETADNHRFQSAVIFAF